MDRADVIYLIRETPGTHGVHDAPTTQLLQRYCTRKSVTRSEYYAAGAIGLAPSYVFALSVAEEYGGELQIKYNNVLYNVIRAYETADGGIELTVQRSDTP